jgi:hypothetical protein
MRRALLVAGVVVLLATVVACRPIGGSTNRLGNDVAACAQFQPHPDCGPQPNLWLGINAPYELFANGDPYTTKCRRGLTGTLNASTCSGSGANTLYRPTGYGYAVDVGPDDVGRALTVRVWDAAASPRVASQRRTNAAYTSATQLLLPSGQTWPGTGRRIYGEGIAPGTTITSLGQSNRLANLSQPLTTTTATRTVSVASTAGVEADCLASLPPFDAAPYNGQVAAQHCQTGDVGTAPFQAQLFDNDGNDFKVDFASPIEGCELYVPANPPASSKNTWTDVCTFTPTQTGVYPLRVKSSAIVRPDGTPITDTGTGYNGFALEVAGGSTTVSTHLYAIDELSLWTNTPAATAQVFLIEVSAGDAGKRLQVDLFDPGDGAAGEYALQVLAPPAGAPGVVPTTGTVIPAPGTADSCRYNPTPSPTRGPNVTGSGGLNATNCWVTTRLASSSAGRYDNSWLRIEVDIADDYTCTTDCWWSVRYDFGSASSLPTDRTVWSVDVVDPAA